MTPTDPPHPPPPASTPPPSAAALPGVLVSYHESGYPQNPVPAAVGTTLQAAAPRAGGSAALELVAGHSHRRSRRWVTVAAVAAAVLLAAVAAVVTNAARTQEPAAQVRAFFAALTSRDGDQLRDLTGCDASPLCTAPALRSGYQPPQQATIDTTGAGTQPDSDHRTVLVRYRVAGHDYAEEVGMTRYRNGFLGHRWIITEPPGARLHVHSARATRVHLGAADLPDSPPTATGARGDNELWVPPGIITAAVDGDDLFLPATLNITVAGGHDPGPITLPATIKPTIADEVNRQVHARIDQCAAQQRLRPDTAHTSLDDNGCPFGYDSPYAIVQQPRWTIRRYPTISLHVQDDATITVQTTTPGTAQLTYQWSLDVLEPRRWTAETATAAITADGHVTINNGSVRWTA